MLHEIQWTPTICVDDEAIECQAYDARDIPVETEIPFFGIRCLRTLDSESTEYTNSMVLFTVACDSFEVDPSQLAIRSPSYPCPPFHLLGSDLSATLRVTIPIVSTILAVALCWLLKQYIIAIPALVIDHLIIPILASYRPSMLNDLAEVAYSRYQEDGDLSHLQMCISYYMRLLELCPSGYPDRPTSLNDLGTAMRTMYERVGDLSVLSDVIRLYRSALEHCPIDHPDRSLFLHNLATSLVTLHNQVGDLNELTEAVSLYRNVFDLCPIGDPNRLTALHNLATTLSTRYERLGDIGDLKEVISLHRTVVQMCPIGDPHRSVALNNLGVALSTLYEQLGDLNDLTAAISLHRTALELRPVGHPDRSTALINLGGALFILYERVGHNDDLKEAIFLLWSALELCPVGHPNRSECLTNLTSALSSLYVQVEDINDLNDMPDDISLYRSVFELHPIGNPDRFTALNNLAGALHARYVRVGDRNDLTESISLHSSALELCPSGHPDRPMSATNLTICLLAQFEHGDDTALTEAFQVCLDAAKGTPASHSGQCSLQLQLANLYMAQSQIQDLDTARQQAMDHIAQSIACEAAPPRSRLSASLQWIHDAEQIHHPSRLHAYEHSLRLLDICVATARSLPSQYAAIKRYPTDLSVNAASCALRQGNTERALELLEQGRALLWTQMSRLRSPLDELRNSYPQSELLIQRFQELGVRLSQQRRPKDEDGPRSTIEAESERYQSLVAEWNSVVDGIRTFDGFSRFLLPPLFSDLVEAAQEGPVIVLIASEYSRDAIIVLRKASPIHLPLGVTLDRLQDLSETHRKTVSNNNKISPLDSQRNFVATLRELWESVVAPVVSALETAEVRKGSRIWWCPTSIFTAFPLHAAGEYRKNGRNLSRIYISSYTPTLTALVKARGTRAAQNLTSMSFAAIGQANPDESEWSPLRHVEEELAVVDSRIPASSRPLTMLNSDLSTKEAALDALRNHRAFHFSCHASQDLHQPFQSFFAMRDGVHGRLSVMDIIDCDLSYHEFAFLSACTTATGLESTPDEMIHLAAALQFSGVKSVIGTLWRVDDEVAFKLVAKFYRDFCSGDRLDSTKAAAALRRGVVELQKPSEGVAFHELLPFVHIGI